MNHFALDRDHRKLMGVCAGLAAATDSDPTVIRMLAVLALFLLGPLAILLYLVAGWIAPDAG